MAGNDDRDRVAAAGPPDRARRRSDQGGEVAVSAGLAVGDFLHGGPDSRLERRSPGCERQVEMGQMRGEIGVELARRLGEEGAAVAGEAIVAGTGPADRDDG